jgi:hypothetical protein
MILAEEGRDDGRKEGREEIYKEMQMRYKRDREREREIQCPRSLSSLRSFNFFLSRKVFESFINCVWRNGRRSVCSVRLETISSRSSSSSSSSSGSSGSFRLSEREKMIAAILKR